MKKHAQRLSALLAAAVLLGSLPRSITRAAALTAKGSGWLESASITWTPVSGADGYRVYADGKAVDPMLIRQYSGYFRADVPGLKAGTHTLRAVPLKNGSEDASAAAEQTVSVGSFDRSGFAWTGGTSSGAYNEDGTLKSGAIVLYLTDQTKDSMTADIVTGSNGQTSAVRGVQEILNAVKKGYETRPVCLRVIGTVTDPAGIADVGGDLCIDGGKKYKGGMTLEGIGEDALFSGFGIKIKNMSNLEVRNLGVMLCDSDEGDNYSLQQDNDHIWIHNCDSFYGEAGGDADQAKGDGAMDCKKSTYVTFSYNHFFDNGKCNLLGLKENTTDGLFITYHHNWYDHSDSRHPRIRFYSAHVYNNYYDGNSKYGIGSTQSSSVFAESNYFRNCKYPILTSMQGSDLASGGTFSGEDGGVVKAYGNIMTGQKAFIPYSQDSSSYDAYVVTNRTDTVPDSVTAKQTDKLGSGYSHRYNNFDTASGMYSYKADAAADVPGIVTANAGRQNGGDFRWEFDNATDDTDSAVNSALMSALRSYRSGVLAIGSGFLPDTGDVTTASSETSQTTTTEPVTTAESGSAGTSVSPQSAYIHNFTESGLQSSFYGISGNLSTSKGTVTYEGKTLTQCLKLETATQITFHAPAAGTLTLVFAEDAGTVKCDGVKSTAAGGILTVPVTAGSHTLTKADSCNLFYMEYRSDGSVTADTTVSQTAAEPLLRGDVDCSGSVQIADAVLLARYIAEDAVTVTAQGLLNAELDGNPGALDAGDLSVLLQGIAGVISL